MSEETPVWQDRFGVYVHFPFCHRRCPYCDFAVSIWSDIPHQAYADAVLQELRLRAPEFQGRRLFSIALGGGTPGLWKPIEIKRVISEICARFGPPEEVSCEVNPEDASPENLRALQDAGVTRLSLGVQSFDAETLNVLGRQHDRRRARESVEAAAAIFANVSVDLIVGAPQSTRESLHADLSEVLSLPLHHVSVYALTIEPFTRFAQLPKPLTSDDEIGERLQIAQERLCQEGFVQYEVSNYARSGQDSKHNSLYWRAGEYLGLGCGAHSFRWTSTCTGERTASVRGASEYMRSLAEGKLATASREAIAHNTLCTELLLSMCRHRDGLPLRWFREQLGEDLCARGGTKLKALVEQGKIILTEESIRLTSRGFFFADDLLWALLATF